MAPEAYSLQARLSAYLRRQYQHDQACALARDIDCDTRTAKNLLCEHWPSARHFQGIVRRFGRDVLDAVFSEDIDETAARLAREVADLEDRLEQKRAMARQVEGALPRLASVRPSSQDGSAEVTAGSRRNG